MLESASEGILGMLGGGDDEAATTVAPTKGDSTAGAEAAATEGTDHPEGSNEATEDGDGASVKKVKLTGLTQTLGQL